MIEKAYSVSQINRYIKNMFTQDFLLPKVYVKGEVSNCKYHTSGHIYFTLKDEGGTINAIMFAGNRRGLSFSLKEGQSVVVLGSIDVYEKGGSYQLYAREILLDGDGVLYQKYMLLKQELEEMGMFDMEYKQPVPKYIKTLGIVTASTGAAIQDIINIATRRNPYVQLILYPALVQGEGAAISIANGIKALEKYRPDVIIVGRGGGSMEDLWAFNEEIVARAIFDCPIPIISAVGHETDTTIADFVADLRAPTPSAAAELAVFDVKEFYHEIDQLKNRLNAGMRASIERTKSQIYGHRLAMEHLSPVAQLNAKRQQCLELEDVLQSTMTNCLMRYQHKLSVLAAKLDGASPLKKLQQGFCYLEDKKGQPIRSVEQVNKGDCLLLHVSDGDIQAVVSDKKSRL